MASLCRLEVQLVWAWGLVSGDRYRLSSGKPKGTSEDRCFDPQTGTACVAKVLGTIAISAKLRL